MFTIDRNFGGWAQAQKNHFADGGTFDQVYRGREALTCWLAIVMPGGRTRSSPLPGFGLSLGITTNLGTEPLGLRKACS